MVSLCLCILDSPKSWPWWIVTDKLGIYRHINEYLLNWFQYVHFRTANPFFHVTDDQQLRDQDDWFLGMSYSMILGHPLDQLAMVSSSHIIFRFMRVFIPFIHWKLAILYYCLSTVRFASWVSLKNLLTPEKVSCAESFIYSFYSFVHLSSPCLSQHLSFHNSRRMCNLDINCSNSSDELVFIFLFLSVLGCGAKFLWKLSSMAFVFSLTKEISFSVEI